MAKKASKKARKRRVVGEPEAPEPEGEDIYGVREPRTSCFSSGCTLLDCVLGGGWAYSRVANIVGDRSTGKTLLAIEAAANFIAANPDGRVVYMEAEAAFDELYAESLGLPLDSVEFPEASTIEDVFEDLEERFDCKEKTLYIIDSLDALSDRDEEKRKIDQNSFGQSKQKKLSELFRRMIQKFKRSQITLIVVSQVRDAIGVAFGEKLKRSGGRALDFYTSQVVWLSNLGQIKVQRKGVKRTVGVNVRVRCKKNKIAPPFREAEFPLIFEYGTEDLQACLDWLVSVKRTDSIGMTLEDAKKLASKCDRLTEAEYAEELENVRDAVREVWQDIEKEFRPKRRKYLPPK